MTRYTVLELHEQFEESTNNLEKTVRHLSNLISSIKGSKILIPDIKMMIDILDTLRDTGDGLYEKAITDGLTQLKNRLYFEEIIKPSLQKETKIACIMTDVDHFKKYNDTYGHSQGDLALKSVAHIVQEVAETNLVARYGGEELSIILAECAAQNPESIGEKIRYSVEKAVIKPFSIEELCNLYVQKYGYKQSHLLHKAFQSVKEDQKKKLKHIYQKIDTNMIEYIKRLSHITVSVGIAKKREDESAESLISRADRALYKAKKGGRNRVYSLSDVKQNLYT